MRVVAITGGIGSGKTTVTGLLASRPGVKVLDADGLVRHIYARDKALRAALVRTFGDGILQGGRVDRRQLAETVFADPAKRKKLERLVHPAVERLLREKIDVYERGKRVKTVLLDIPLLFEAGLDRLADIIVVVWATRRQQMERAAGALQLPRAHILKRIQAQMPLRDKMLLADIVIDNSQGLKHTQQQVEDLWRRWTVPSRSTVKGKG